MGLEKIQYTYRQFSLFRIILGSYLFLHFINLIPYGPELFSREGLIPDPSLQGTYGIFPNILNHLDSALGSQLFLGGLTLLSLTFIADWKRPWVSVSLWYGWACLFNRNIFIGNPGLPFVGWLLLACALIPTRKMGENLGQKHVEWKMPPLLFWGAWFMMAAGYTVSGIHKMGSPSWANGTAILRLLENPLARDVPWREWLLAGPTSIPIVMTYLSLALETLFFPLALFRWTRPWVWLAMVGMHFGILSLIGFADLTWGVLMIHFFTFDARWLSPVKAQSKELILFFDGVCGLCNSFVDFVMSEDVEHQFKFSPLQGPLAASRLSPAQTSDLKSLILIEGDHVLQKSDAVLRICSYLGGIWRLTEVFYLLPKPLRDSLYSFVAQHRYRVFGKKDTCRFPTSEERARFI